ncbi:hypothetical protein KOR42_22560 [Thalassoglobus neptunius]|uniref:Uncharacterized protein n=1 Tax=Thalassoglobus neptunius TaxID=1938619 RepID=A0A5C5X843_9PLAN|nr:hypothetical protein [Thalassoglobus neptunius]TWT58869.1 hypothetical protein KOR42_22560 [Thalassoglobus neptunius]
MTTERNPYQYQATIPFKNVGSVKIPPFCPILIGGPQRVDSNGKNPEWLRTGSSPEERSSSQSETDAVKGGGQRGLGFVAFNGMGAVASRNQGHCTFCGPEGLTAQVDESGGRVSTNRLLLVRYGNNKLEPYNQGVYANIVAMFVSQERFEEGYHHITPLPHGQWLGLTNQTSTKGDVSSAQIISNDIGVTVGSIRNMTFLNIWGRIANNRRVLLGMHGGTIIPIAAEC